MLDELPTLEFAATAVALALSLRALILLGKSSKLVRGEARIESARARDLVGAAVLASAVVYAVRVERASTWFLVASAVALLAQLLGYYLRSRAQKLPLARDARATPLTRNADEEDDDDEEEDEDEDANACPRCGGSDVVELTDSGRYLAGLSTLGRVSVEVCRTCGALSGQLENPGLLGVGAEHGTSSRKPELEAGSAKKADAASGPRSDEESDA